MIKILVNGAQGKMGQMLCSILSEDKNIQILKRESGQIVEDKVNIIIDFSSPSGAKESFALAKELGAAFLCGTTNLDEDFIKILKEEKTIPVFFSPNVSIGMALFKNLLCKAQKEFKGYILSMHEVHHAQKKDAPSGTAKNLAVALKIPVKDITYERIGTVVGTHILTLTSPAGDEEIILTHRAIDRKLFAKSAVKIALWLLKQKPNFYNISDFLEAKQ